MSTNPHPSLNSSPRSTNQSSSINANSRSKPKHKSRRSLITLFHSIPLGGARYSSYDDIDIDIDVTSMKTNTSTTVVGSVLPQDIIHEIVDLLSPADILNFSLTSTYLRHLLLPALYDTVILKSSKHCRLTLTMLLAHPHLCSYIKKLAVRPNYYLAWPKPDDVLDEGWVANMIIDLSKELKNMHTFDWDGLELPKDELWEVLRDNCLQLKGIFTNIGTRPLDPENTLFSFSNLTSFSLIVRHGLGGSELFPVLEELPPSFWDMVLNRCPGLQELAICSFSSSARVFNFERVTQGRWPKLHTLTLGSFGYQSDFTLGPPGLTDSVADDDDGSGNDSDNDNDGAPRLTLGQFLDLHSELKYVRFLWNFKRWMSPATVPLTFSSSSSTTPLSSPTTSSTLPNLDTFIGIYQQLAHIPHPQKIETLDLTCEPVYESRLPTVIPILRQLTGLTSLDVWMHVGNIGSGVGGRGDQTAVFRSVLEACPSLVDFHFMCTTSFPVSSLTQLLSHFHLLPSLKRFSLTKGHNYGDENMLSTVLRILRDCPKLVQVNIRWAREKCLNHLKQEGVYDVVEWESGEGGGGGGKGKGGGQSKGTTARRPKALMVFERGIPLLGKPFMRRYKYTLMSGGYGGRKKGWSLVKQRMVGSTRVGGGGGVSTGGVSGESIKSVESGTEPEIDTEVEVAGDREEGEEDEGATVKGKEVKRIGQTPATN